MGIVLHTQGERDRALESLERSIRIEPDYAQAHWNRSLVLLSKGRFTEGWEEYQWRRKTGLIASAYSHTYEKPRWDGTPFAGKRLLVHFEQGFGDSLQFVRYLPMVKRLGGTVIFETLEPLYGLLRDFDGIDELVVASAERKSEVEFDAYRSLMDLPRLFETTIETIPAEVPYIYPNPAKTEYWRDRLSGTAFKVGLVWAGRSMRPNETLSLRNRSFGLKHFVPLAEIAGVELFGLQKGPAAAQVDELPERIVACNLGGEFEDFTDTAGAI